ncbi:MAG: carbohydrate kinase family protein [Desulfovibrio sp.]|nr:carbohydrate kinase family protein [Desulfovibrio sp.]
MAVYITGSVAYDRIMNFSGKFADSILPDRTDNLNVSFYIDRMEQKPGGNAGNVAHTLKLLGENSVIIACVGEDFDPYKELLQKRGLPLDGIRRMDNERTAAAYIITDSDGNQITGFHAAAMLSQSDYAFPALNPEDDLGIISPSNPVDMRDHARLYRTRGVRYIYDPAQQLPVIPPTDLLEGIRGAYLLVGNDYEIGLITKTVGLGRKELAAMTARGLVTTLGERGSLVTENDGEEAAVPAVPVSAVADPTGAGDAYRAGLVKGLLLKQPLLECARLGATCAAYCLEHNGTQEHDFNLDDFFRRHAGAFGEGL